MASSSLITQPLEDPAETATLHTLAAHAELSRLTDDPALDAKLIARGFDGVAAIARASRKDFFAGVRGLLTPARATAVYRQARAQLATARTALAGLLTD